MTIASPSDVETHLHVESKPQQDFSIAQLAVGERVLKVRNHARCVFVLAPQVFYLHTNLIVLRPPMNPNVGEKHVWYALVGAVFKAVKHFKLPLSWHEVNVSPEIICLERRFGYHTIVSPSALPCGRKRVGYVQREPINGLQSYE